MLQFLKYVFATIVGLFLFLILSIFILIGIFTASMPDDKAEKEELSKNSVLKLDLDKRIVERESDDFFSNLDVPFNQTEGTIGLLQLKQAIAHAKNDADIKGIHLNLSTINAGFASLQEIRNALLDFKTSGKKITAFSESYSEGSYYLASVADKIVLPTSGSLELNGLSTELLFFKGTLEKLELKPEIFKVGEYKSAVEPFILDKMSDPNREQVNSFLNAIYDHYLAEVSKSRGMEFSTLKLISDSMLVRNSTDALKYKLITDEGYIDAVEDFYQEKFKAGKDGKINFISYKSYTSKFTEPEKEGGNQIAVIFASGEIHSGKGDENTIGSETISKEIKKARLDKNIKAIVLRVNSPGGSAIASDIIWREVLLTKKVKTIIASMSDVAASGGYYISMACDTIVAQPTTITGSIGVFGIMLNAEGFLKNKLGVTSDRVKTGKFSDIGSFTREMSTKEKQIIQSEVNRIYEEFTFKAAQGRSMTQDSLKRIASGRVWSGIEAKGNNLVDIYGGLDDAIKVAANKAGLQKDYNVRYFPEQKNIFFKQLLQSFEEGEATMIEAEFGRFYPYIKTLKDIKNLDGIQTRLPFEIIIN